MSLIGNSGYSGQGDDEPGAGAYDLEGWDHRDPDAATVYYDLSAWTADQQAELIEALAESSIPHGWEGTELAVPEVLEAETDALFEVLEARLGLQAGDDTVSSSQAPAEDEPLTEYELDDWDLADRAILTEALVASRVAHRWENDVLVVPTAAEEAVEELMSDIESGQVWLVPDGDDDSDLDDADDLDPAAVLLAFRTAGERLARDPLDAEGLETLLEVLDEADPERPLVGIAPSSWRQVCALADELADALAGGDTPDEPLAVDTAERLAAVAANLLT